MLDPAAVGSGLAPGDKVSISFHKAKAEPGAPGFVSNAQSAGLIPGGPTPPPPPVRVPQMSAVSQPAVPDHRGLLLAQLRQRMLGR